MATGANYRVPLRRIRERKTNYWKRIALIKSGLPRLIVRVFNNSIVVQLAEFDEKGDRIIAQANSRELVKMGWKGHPANTPAGYLLGRLIAKRALEKGVKKAVLDIGFHTPVHGSTIFAVLKGAIDGGLEIPHSEEALPSEERVRGEHIATYARALKEQSPEKYERQFGGYLKRGLNPEDLPSHFDEMLQKVSA
ncbi:MAG: 50S ribosomal protein L18 [Candidatus Diapherotrites archaeon]|nr:50S ribosomal protein L18 [Candidatus Diapherotrites archaeon]